ncbi:MAG: hypothetical protein ACT6UH_06700 [Hydrogenophaga sp.]|jgi:hypothetical protein|uniref:hypothetical protein n=1 Tax=Hydrogenophaga sp. TaxID=1904254 RepID=UPI0040353E5A
MLSKAVVLLSLVALIFPMVFFTFASPPLLILKHDTPQDARFVRGLFNYYYSVVVVAASLGGLGQLAVGRVAVGLAMGGVAAFVFAVRRWVVPRMDALRERIAGGDASAIPSFRRLHMAGILLNLVQVGVVAWGMAKLAAL